MLLGEACTRLITPPTTSSISTSGIKYISFDLCYGSGNLVMYLWDTAFANVKVDYNTKNIVNNTTNVKVFDQDGNIATQMVYNEWYTFVIEVKADTAGGWSTINFNSKSMNMAIDNIVYYYNDVPALWN